MFVVFDLFDGDDVVGEFFGLFLFGGFGFCGFFFGVFGGVFLGFKGEGGGCCGEGFGGLDFGVEVWMGFFELFLIFGGCFVVFVVLRDGVLVWV